MSNRVVAITHNWQTVWPVLSRQCVGMDAALIASPQGGVVMGLSSNYGVVFGTKHNYYRDDPDDFGRYCRGNLEIEATAGIYHCAMDVVPKSIPDGIQWRVVKIRASDFAKIASRDNDSDAQPSAPGTSALDHIRAPSLHPPFLFKQVWLRSLLSSFVHWFHWNPP